LHALQNADGGTGHVAAVYAKLVAPDAFGAFKAAVEHNPQLHVVAYRESQFFAEQAAKLSRFITSVGALIALLMGAGAVVGAVNIMYSTISARAPEIATLRAIGFHPGPTFAAVLAEGMLLGLLGGVVGVIVAYLLFNGHRASTLNGYTQVVFHFSISVPLLAASLAFALVMGLIGGIFPAVRAARLPVAVALRET
jgi:putative ABC transport system permease protein